uniref:Candidate secreted effector n=1 Tax=Meloidogyne incognita TaxID=6306 RepID=A0A914LXA9_MELIC
MNDRLSFTFSSLLTVSILLPTSIHLLPHIAILFMLYSVLVISALSSRITNRQHWWLAEMRICMVKSTFIHITNSLANTNTTRARNANSFRTFQSLNYIKFHLKLGEIITFLLLLK